jgi:hypothetical protein
VIASFFSWASLGLRALQRLLLHLARVHSPTKRDVLLSCRRAAELTLLGTVSACPSNHRNVSAYYLDLFDKGGLLMDCGEQLFICKSTVASQQRCML